MHMRQSDQDRAVTQYVAMGHNRTWWACTPSRQRVPCRHAVALVDARLAQAASLSKRAKAISEGSAYERQVLAKTA